MLPRVWAYGWAFESFGACLTLICIAEWGFYFVIPPVCRYTVKQNSPSILRDLTIENWQQCHTKSPLAQSFKDCAEEYFGLVNNPQLPCMYEDVYKYIERHMLVQWTSKESHGGIEKSLRFYLTLMLWMFLI